MAFYKIASLSYRHVNIKVNFCQISFLFCFGVFQGKFTQVANSGCKANFPVNKVWSSDITYIKLEKGFAYLAAIIDWNTKKVLSWKLSNTMDVALTTTVLQDALSKYPKPEIFNSNQGSQYTAKRF